MEYYFCNFSVDVNFFKIKVRIEEKGNGEEMDEKEGLEVI